MKLFFTLIFTSFSFYSLLFAQPKQEIRAVWLTTNYALDWPSKPASNQFGVDRQKEELCTMLDQLKAANFNLVMLQTRIRGNVIYPSQIEPWAPFIIGKSGINSGYDPLDFAVKACHERGLECHAWFVTYPLGHEKVNGHRHNSPAVINNRALVRKHLGELYLDPGDPATDTYLLSLIKEIVSGYDIDGIHLDYIRYPDKSDHFPDQSTYRTYGKNQDLSSWRRSNINRFVYAAYDQVKIIKPWVQVSSSVLGMYQKIPGNTQTHWTAYSSVYQDPVDWLSKEKHDFIVPMMYYSGDLFYPFMHDWTSHRGQQFVVPGIGLYRLDKSEGDWSPQTIIDQVQYSRENQTQGNAFYRLAYLLENKKGIADKITSLLYRFPSTLPALTWLDSIPPSKPAKPDAIRQGNCLLLSWEGNPESEFEKIVYHIYRSEQFPINTNDPCNLVVTCNQSDTCFIPIRQDIESGYYYLVTASDRYHNESPSSSSVYFCTGSFEK